MKRFFSGWSLGMVMGVALGAAVPVVAATCIEQNSGGVGGSGFLGGKRMVMEMAVGETGVVACQQQQRLVLAMDAGDQAKIYTCQKR